MLPSLASLLMVPLSVVLGLPLFRFPWGVHCQACLGSRVGVMRRACPRYFHRFFFIVVTIPLELALSRTSLLVMKSFHRIFRRRRRHLRWNDASRLSASLFIDQVSVP